MAARPRSGLSLRRAGPQVARHVGWGLLTLLVISVITFAATSVKSADDIARGVIGRQATQEQIDAFVTKRGLDEPLVTRYVSWLTDFARGDWGTSVITGRRVREDVEPWIANTAILAALALIFAVPLAVGLGVYMAKHAGSRRDIALSMTTVVVAALPEFVVGIVFMTIFAIELGVLPVDSSGLAFGTFEDKAKAFALPSLTLVVASVPYLTRMSRAAVRETLTAPYTRSAVLRGLAPGVVTWDHAMRNAATTIMNVVSLNLVYLIGGVIVVENLFAFPGMGHGFVDAIGNGDTVMVQALALTMGAMVVVFSTLVDILALYFNPRLRDAGR